MRWPLILIALIAGPAAAREPSRTDLFCPGFRDFVEAPLPAEGVRTATFLPFGLDPNAIDMYAPMQSSPSDAVSNALYERTAWLTHYKRFDDFGARLGDCLKERLVYAPVREVRGEDAYRAVATSRSLKRRIEITTAPGNCPADIVARNPEYPPSCVLITVSALQAARRAKALDGPAS